MSSFDEQRQRLRQARQARQAGVFVSRATTRQNSRQATTRSAARPTYNANGTITRSGGTPERPRGNLSNSGQRAGARVSTANGQVVGQSRSGGQQIENEIKVLQDRLAKLSATIPNRLITGDPNAQTPDLRPNYLDDLVYAEDSGTLFRWFADSANAGAGAEWQPLFQTLQNTTAPPTATVFIDGAQATATDGTSYTGTISGGWSAVSGGGGGVTLVYYINGRTRDPNTGFLNWTHPDSSIYREDTPGGVTRETDNSLTIATPGIYRLSLTLQSNYGTSTFARIFIDTPNLLAFIVDEEDTAAPLTQQPLHVCMIFETYSPDVSFIIRYHSSDGTYIPGYHFASIGIEKLS